MKHINKKFYDKYINRDKEDSLILYSILQYKTTLGKMWQSLPVNLCVKCGARCCSENMSFMSKDMFTLNTLRKRYNEFATLTAYATFHNAEQGVVKYEIRKVKHECRFLTKKGCNLPYKLRPLVCVAHTCNHMWDFFDTAPYYKVLNRTGHHLDDLYSIYKAKKKVFTTNYEDCRKSLRYQKVYLIVEKIEFALNFLEHYIRIIKMAKDIQ